MEEEMLHCPLCRERDFDECAFVYVKKEEDGKTYVICCEVQAKKVKKSSID